MTTAIEQKTELSGAEKAVLVLLSLEEHIAVPIIAELDVENIRKIREIAQQMEGVPVAARDQVYLEFIQESEKRVAMPRDGEQYFRRLATKALGENKSHDLFFEGNRTALEHVSRTDPERLASVLEHEKPQLIAAILSQLEGDRASQVLLGLPEDMRPDVLLALSRTSDIPAAVLEEIAGALSAELPQPGATNNLQVDGVGSSAALVRQMGRAAGESLLAGVEGHDELLAAEIRKAMYSFEDLMAIDKKQLRTLLSEVPQEKLSVALKAASDELKEHFFSGMSGRAADLLREDISLLQGVRLSEVEEAQQHIVEVALRLQDEGAIQMDSEAEVV